MTPIYVPEGVSISAQNIVDDINMRIDNDLEPKSAEFVGDDITEILHLPDRSICDSGDAPVVYTSDGTTDSILTEGNDYTVDYQAGNIYLLRDHVDSGLTLYCDYKIRHWSDQLIWRLLGNGLQHLFPRYYVISELTPTLDEDSGEYPLVSSVGRMIEAVIDVEDAGSDGTYRLSQGRDWKVVRHGSSIGLRLYGDVEGTLTVRCALRPGPFLIPSTTLEDLGLPEQIREPLVLYVCWQAVMQKMPARARWDNITALNNEAKTTFFDHARMAALFKSLLDVELQTNHMRLWTSRGL